MKFQDPSIHCSKVIGGIKKRDTHTDTQAKNNMLHQLFQSWGHKKKNTQDLCQSKKLRNDCSVARIVLDMNLTVLMSKIQRNTFVDNILSN